MCRGIISPFEPDASSVNRSTKRRLQPQEYFCNRIARDRRRRTVQREDYIATLFWRSGAYSRCYCVSLGESLSSASSDSERRAHSIIASSSARGSFKTKHIAGAGPATP